MFFQCFQCYFAFSLVIVFFPLLCSSQTTNSFPPSQRLVFTSPILLSYSPTLLSTPAFSVSIFTLSLPSWCRLSLFLTPSSFSMLSLSISRHSFSVHVLSTTVCFLLPSFSVRCHMHKNRKNQPLCIFFT